MKKQLTRTLRHGALFVAFAAFSLTGIALLYPQSASAEYVEANLIEDNLFLDAASMSQQGIQDFLVARNSYLAGYQSWSDRDNANVYASRIIYEAAQDYGISPKVLLATLQKEQSLVTAQNPSQSQLNFAMGYGCPDSTGCGDKYRGFFKQVDNASWQFRFNYETSRGNKWWNPNLSYPCGGTTRYYSPGLKPGNYVTWYDDAGTAYKAFTIANGASASLYCYTPHAYPGSANQYYSGSFNFVKMYELWFGSTHAAVMVSHGLNISMDQMGTTNTDAGVQASFTVTNGTNGWVDLGYMGVAGYDSSNNNVGYPMQRMVLAPYQTITYSHTKVFSNEDTYRFWITTNTPSGAWVEDYPQSSSISVIRRTNHFIQAMPQITVQPTITGANRTNGTGTATFTINNRSARTANLGKMGLAVYGPNGENYGMPLNSVSIPAGQNYVYTASQKWQAKGTYTAWITNTKDNGATWDDTFFPFPANGSINRRIQFDIKSSPTITATPSVSVPTPHAGQQVNAGFTLHNFGDVPVNTGGKVGLAIYDPNGRNVGLPMQDLTIDANGDLVYSHPTTFYTPGRYTAWVTYYNGRTYNDSTYPEVESGAIQRAIEFTVKPSPTITATPSLSTPSPRAGQQVNAGFTLHNFGSTAVTKGKIGLAIYGPNGENVGLAMQDMAVQPGSDQVYSLPTTFYNPGRYTAWITYYDGQNYNDTSFPSVESGAIQRAIEFTVKPSPTITVSPAFSPAPRVGQTTNGSFTLHNYGTETINSGKIGLAIYGPNGENVGLAMQDMIMAPGADMVYQKSTTFTTPGTYTAWVTYYNGRSYNDSTWPEPESGSIVRKITFTVAP